MKHFVIFLLFALVFAKDKTKTFYGHEIISSTPGVLESGANAAFGSTWSFTANSPGASYVAKYDIFPTATSTAPEGKLAFACQQMLTSSEVLCDGLFLLKGGSITFTSLYTESAHDPDGGVRNNNTAITGGTGDYFGVTGQMKSAEFETANPFVSDYKFEIKLDQAVF